LKNPLGSAQISKNCFLEAFPLYITLAKVAFIVALLQGQGMFSFI
jgi:hypothetical protein